MSQTQTHQEELTLNQEIATTILKQLNGQIFVRFTGAYDLCAIDKGLQFKLPLGDLCINDDINFVRIELTPEDTYNISYYHMHDIMKVVNEEIDYNDILQLIKTDEGIYFDMLQDCFTQATGLYTHF